MAASIRKADYFSMRIANRAGTGAGLLAALQAAGVNLLAFSGFPVPGGAQVDFAPENARHFLAAAKRAGLVLSKRKTVFLMRDDDRVGALNAVLVKLAGAGVSIVAMQSVTAGKGRYGAIFWVRPKDIARTARLLGAR
jgi:hypothetical protein